MSDTKTTTLFRPVQRHQKKLRCAIEGTSGSGKTMSALYLAGGLVGGDFSKVAMIDTEHNSAELYDDLGRFAVLPFAAPYQTKRYITAMQAAAAEGYEVVIIDSLSHAWTGPGGVLEYVDQYAARHMSGNKWAAWDAGTKMQNDFIETMLALPIHVIATMRSKTVWGEEVDENSGKRKPVKIGVGAQQRKEMDYEFDLVLQLDGEHVAAATKHRTRDLWEDRFEKITEKHGAELLRWLTQGSAGPVPPAVSVPAAASTVIDEHQLLTLEAWVEDKGKSLDGFSAWLARKGFHDGALEELPVIVYERIIGDWEIPKAAIAAPESENEDFDDDVSTPAPAFAPTSVRAREQSEALAKAAVTPEPPPVPIESTTPIATPAAEPAASAPPADEKPAETAAAPGTEDPDHGYVSVMWPNAAAAVSIEVGERTRYGGLVFRYLASSGGGDENDYAVFDDAGNECGAGDVIPTTVWGQTFTVVKIEAKQPAPASASGNGKGRKTKAKAEPAAGAPEVATQPQPTVDEMTDAEAEVELDRAIGPAAQLPDPTPADAAKKNTITALAIVCAELEKAGWSEQSWRGVMSALTGGKRSRKELSETEANNVTRSLRYELEQLTAKAS